MLPYVSYKNLSENKNLISFLYRRIRHSSIYLNEKKDIKKVMKEFGATLIGSVPSASKLVDIASMQTEALIEEDFLHYKIDNIDFMILPEVCLVVCDIKHQRYLKLIFAKIHRKYRNTNIPVQLSPKSKFDTLKEFINKMYLNQETIDEITESLRPFVSTFEKRQRYGLNMNLSVILTGAPGDGKTYSATKIIERIGGLLDLNIVREEANTFKVSDLMPNFAALLDDMNVAHFQRTGGYAEICQKILVEMDQPNTNRLFILTTNEVISRENIDRAFFRPGRVQNIITVSRPDNKVKARIIDDIANILFVVDGIKMDSNFVQGLKLFSSEEHLSLAEMMRLKNLILSDIIMEEKQQSPKYYIEKCQAVEVPSVPQHDSEVVSFE